MWLKSSAEAASSTENKYLSMAAFSFVAPPPSSVDFYSRGLNIYRQNGSYVWTDLDKTNVLNTERKKRPVSYFPSATRSPPATASSSTSTITSRSSKKSSGNGMYSSKDEDVNIKK